MKPRLSLLLLTLSLWLSPSLALAGVEQISEKEFKRLAEELAPKVNLFAEGWKQDPKAEYYGGTTRDYLYWLKGQFAQAKNPQQAEAIATKLKSLSVIDVREFIIGDSDVDIISRDDIEIDPKAFGVRKIDSQSPDLLDPTTEMGQNERLQGYIPAEKIRLSREGLMETDLGNGLAEIYQGKLSVHFSSAEDFAKSKFAQEGINHPILLALRYLRLQAINYYRSHGNDYPDLHKLMAGIDPESAKAVRAVIERSLKNKELKPYLNEHKFHSWINGAIQKAFRSYTNPTAALELMKQFGADELPVYYRDDIEPLNQYVFAQYRDPNAIEAALKKYKVSEKDFYSSPQKYFSDGKIYHGTKTEEAFAGIQFQGVLPSENGLAGAGLYGVAKEDKEFSEGWGGDKDRLLRFEVKPEAKIVDITGGEGLRVWTKYVKEAEDDYEEFARIFGADIISYPYNPQAFVVKNSAMLGRGEGVYRSIRTIGEILELATKISDPKKLIDLLSVNQLTSLEQRSAWQASQVKESAVLEFLEKKKINPKFLEIILGSGAPWAQSPGVLKILRGWMLEKDATRRELAMGALLAVDNPSPEELTFLDGFFPKGEKPLLSLTELAKISEYLKKYPAEYPRATEFYTKELKEIAERGGSAKTAANFIESVKVSPKQAEVIYKVLKNAPGRYEDSQKFRLSLAKSLTRVEGFQEKALAALLSNINGQAKRGDDGYVEVIPLLKGTHELFPGNPSLEKPTLKVFEGLLTNDPFRLRNAPKLLPLLKQAEGAKKIAFTSFVSQMKAKALAEVYALTLLDITLSFPLSDKEFAQVVALTPAHESSLITRLYRDYLPKQLDTIGPLSAKALVEKASERSFFENILVGDVKKIVDGLREAVSRPRTCPSSFAYLTP